MRVPARPKQDHGPSRQIALAELCQRLRDPYAPAAILINRKYDCLYLLGPTDRYLRLAPGQPTYDLLSMASPGVRTKLRSAIQQASQENGPVVVTGGRIKRDGNTLSFGIAVQPVTHEGEELLFVCFIDEPIREHGHDRPKGADNVSRVVEIEQELEVTRTELQRAIRNLMISNEEQKAVNEEALSVNEEYQSTNEELLASKEELQSLNEELTALNSQLQETLEQQRTTSNDLENVLDSTDVATLCSSTPTLIFVSLRQPRNRCLASFPAMLGDRLRISARWLSMALFWQTPELCCGPSIRSSTKSKVRGAPGTFAAYCPTARKIKGSRVSSSRLPTSQREGIRRTRLRLPSRKHSKPMSQNRAFWPLPAMTSVSRSRPSA